MVKSLITILGNIGGIVALLSLIYDVWSKRVLVGAYIFEYNTEGKLTFAHITISNRSSSPVSIIDISVEMADGQTYMLSHNKGFIWKKPYGNDYFQNIFTEQFPLNIPAKQAKDALVEVIDCNQPLSNIEKVSIITARRTKKIYINKEHMQSVDLFRFR